MSNYHVRTGQDDGNAYTIIFHIPIPSVNNRVGVNYRDALVRSGTGGTTLMTTGASAGQISAAEAAQISSGEIYEYVEVMTTNPPETAGAFQTRIDSRYSQLVTSKRDELQRILEYWGHDRNVP